MNKENLAGFKLIKTYPGSKEIGYFEPYTTGELLKYPEFWKPIYKERLISSNTLFLYKCPNILFKKAFNFTDKGTTYFFDPENGFYIIVNNTRAYFKAEVSGLHVKFIFRDNTFTEYNLEAFPIYCFSEQIPA